MKNNLVFPKGAKIHDMTQEIEKAMSILPPRYSEVIKSIVDIGDVYYIQHVKEDVDTAQIEFLKICDRELGTDYHTKEVHRFGIVGRVLSDSDSELYKTWNRFMCIDENYREWEQTYYAMNAEKHINEATCLNELSPLLTQHFRDTKIKHILNEK